MFDENIKKANKVKADTIIKALEKRGMKGYYCDTREDALELALSFINEGDKVACGGSMTLGEIGLKDKLGLQMPTKCLPRESELLLQMYIL